MIVSALLTSVGINVGLCVLYLSLYSLLRKQPSNVSVYAPRMVAKERAGEKQGTFSSFSLDRFVPSPGWIVQAWRPSDDELLAVAGFDAYVFLRIFVFSLRIFSFACIIGICVLLPINYTGKQLDSADISDESLDLFTIANVESGSKRLWVHFCAVYLISGAACCLLYFEYRDIAEKRFAYFLSSPPQPHHFTNLVRGIPKSHQQIMSETVQEFFTQFYPSSYLSHQMVHHMGKVKALVHEANMLSRKVLHLKSMPRLQRKLQREGFLGLFGAKVDPVDLYSKKLEDVEEDVRLGQSEFYRKEKEVPAAFVSFKSRYGAAVASKIPQSTNPLLWVTEPAPEPRDVYWRFLSASYLQRWISSFVVMVAVFILTILFLIPVAIVQALTQLDQLEKFLPFLKKVLTLEVVSEIITGYLPSLILQMFMVIIPPIMMLFSAMQGFVSISGIQKSATTKVLYFTIWNVFFVTVLSGSVFSQINTFLSNPKDIPRQLAIVVPGQMLNVYSPKYISSGHYWPIVHNCTIFSLVFMQILAIGIFVLKKLPYAAGCLVPLCIITLLFNNYCTKRFIPMFSNYAAEDLIRRDNADERNLVNAYRDPQFSTDEDGNYTLLSTPEV
uniref:CSC1/OSCA1-like 7TM region domain-containing protein n=1 Tax=Araucaria cunninghamii TaxID=56994 RepID=A0A0D6QSJ1_ARACU